jgi:hypothetical protein
LIPVIAQQTDVPVALRSLRWVDLTKDYDAGTRELVKIIHGVSDKPPVGPPPDYVTKLQKRVGGLSKEASALGVVLLARPEDSTGFERAYKAKSLYDAVSFLSVDEFNDAVDELESFGLVKTLKTFGTAPFEFNELSPTYALFLHFKDEGLLYSPLEDIRTVAAAVAAKGELRGHELQDITKLSPVRLNRAVAYLAAYQHADVRKLFGTAPFEFASVAATRRTREFVQSHCE